jgi:hypothetical protein
MAYIATPPDIKDLVTPQSHDYASPEPPASNSAKTPNRANTRWSEYAPEIVARNTGLLLVAASQLFVAIVNMAVKVLDMIDPPVPALEVFLRLTFSSAVDRLLFFTK